MGMDARPTKSMRVDLIFLCKGIELFDISNFLIGVIDFHLSSNVLTTYYTETLMFQYIYKYIWTLLSDPRFGSANSELLRVFHRKEWLIAKIISLIK